MARRPSSAAAASLVEVFGKARGAARVGAGLKIEQALYTAAMKKLARLAASHPEVDMASDVFFTALHRRADAWWDAKVMKGAGVDW